MQKICVGAGVMNVTAHGMRGLHSTLAVQSGITGHVVAAALGDESFSTTVQSSAIVMMVIVTPMVTPPAPRWSLARRA